MVSHQIQLNKAKFILLPISLSQIKPWNQEAPEVKLDSWNNSKPEYPELPARSKFKHSR